MADKNRFHNDGGVISMPVASGTVISKGDFICLSSGNAIPASSVADAGDAAANREAAADAFMGIALEASASGETDNIRVDISLDHQFILDLQSAAAASIGDLLEIYATTLACAAQQVVAGTTSPVAVCIKDKSASGTEVLCKLVPQKALNTPQA
jgi:hypothetical protein